MNWLSVQKMAVNLGSPNCHLMTGGSFTDSWGDFRYFSDIFVVFIVFVAEQNASFRRALAQPAATRPMVFKTFGSCLVKCWPCVAVTGPKFGTHGMSRPSRIHGMVIHGYPWVIHGLSMVSVATRVEEPAWWTLSLSLAKALRLRLAMTKSCQIHVSASRGDNARWCRYRNFIVFLRWYLLYMAGLNEEPCQLSTFILRSSHSSPWMPLICRYSVIFKT